MMWSYYNGWSWFVMTGLMFLFWGGVIALIVWAFQTFGRPRRGSD